MLGAYHRRSWCRQLATNGYMKGVDNKCTACVLVALDGATQTKWRLISDEATALRTVAAPGSQKQSFPCGCCDSRIETQNISVSGRPADGIQSP